MVRYTLIPGFAFAFAIAVSAAVAATQSAHIHGEGRVNIAIDGDRIFMALESPGTDIVGFEHAAHSSDEKAAVATAIAQLEDPLQILRFDADAGCETKMAQAGLNSEKEKHDEHEEHGYEESHGSFVAEYEFQCSDMDALEFIEFRYFQRFTNAQSLEIVLIDASGQRRVKVDRTDPELRLTK